ncbi:hypothetical protein K493DRAFT_234296 [Basidiobolus meristosporus CBS 931.73]|uniref:Sulfate transporter family protein n=1 Tax=Basidiobolus meristosporus CBS 931.73 TaxID=1314790 RepID=A0A1Y1XU28_9FUNG|nr:hypothetical protein K493DRAFT_234296 [Basidiobolus meristosporus CBS 931.73]|eukprot:ORX89223.1 hypothetical protein K493DRAFT_234296 [Basidiobolus meristosporus CBS 931.73]
MVEDDLGDDRTDELLDDTYPHSSNIDPERLSLLIKGYNSLLPGDDTVDDSASAKWSRRRSIARSIYSAHYAKEAPIESPQEIPRDPVEFLKYSAQFLPAVALGVILNLLNAVSYGFICFPTAHPIFASFGPDGISMYLVSCIVGQIVFSAGGSAFKGANAGMICDIVIRDVGEENPKAVVATVMVGYAAATIFTGLTFMLLGVFKLGSLVGFFPRHILVGCIGGVGWFLFQTAIEVSSRTPSFSFAPDILKKYLEPSVLALWASSLGAALLMRMLQKKIKHPMFVPCFFLSIPVLFYSVVFFGGWTMEELRTSGWVFPLPESKPFYDYWTHFDFSQTKWSTLPSLIPVISALTFFGILHVPINVPALAVTNNQDNVDVNKELVAHGYSNLGSGFLGSFQNYLMYSTSTLFIKCGGDSRVAGLMLALGTTIIFLIGPTMVGYIPTMVVGGLIFHIGMELMKEGIWDPIGHVDILEYTTILTIVISMAIFGFIEGMFFGVVLACIFFVYLCSTRRAIRASLTGLTAKSTVRRPRLQQRFLNEVGSMIQVLRLQGFMFFGSINGVENNIREILDARQWVMNPIRFLVLDFQLVQGLDFSAAEAFVRVKRLLKSNDVYMVVSGVSADSDIGVALRAFQIWGGFDDAHVQNFLDLNAALEWCENVLLQADYLIRAALLASPNTIDIPDSRHDTRSEISFAPASPRQRLLKDAARAALDDEPTTRKSLGQVNQPLALLLQIFQETSFENYEDILRRISAHFQRLEVRAGTVLWDQDDEPDALYLVEQGLLHFSVEMNQHSKVIETVIPGVMIGEMSVFTNQLRRDTLVAEIDSVLWKLDKDVYDKLSVNEADLILGFVKIGLGFTAQAFVTMKRLAYALQ